MANGTNTAASKTRRCGAFHLYMDEFCGSKTTVSIQWDHRKARNEEDSSSPINSSRNAKIPTRPSDIIQAAEERIKVAIHPEHPEQTIVIGSTLTEEGRKALCDLLRCSLDVFAWKPTDMTGVPRHIAEHRLNVCEGCSLMRQNKRSQAPERNKAIQEEVKKLVDAGIMKEVHYHSWLSNPVMVKKHDNNWMMCVDFKDLNKACPKDGYPLSEIDWKVESLCGYPFKCFLDAYKRNLEVYVDDLVIKSRTEHEIIRDMEETFKTLREINMKLNPKKCTFGIEEGTFLGYKVNTRGIMLASLYSFLSKSAEKSLLFFKTLKKCTKKNDFQWTAEVEAAFKEMKKLIAELPTLAAPMEKKELIVYLAAAREAVSAVLMTEMEAKQMPVYFVSRALQDGSSCIDGSGAGLIRTNPKGVEFTYALRFRFEAANNEAGYETLIAGLRIAEQIGVKNLQANVDSRLVTNQVNGSYIAKEPGVIQYLEKVKVLSNSFKKFSIKQEPRSENKKADALSKIASTSFAHLTKQVLVEELKEKSINEAEVLVVVEEEEDTWMTPIYNYLTEETLPAEKEKAIVVRRKSGRNS
ncbi:reverse transcriptase domain-containing protein [Tanacetum coccineum]